MTRKNINLYVESGEKTKNYSSLEDIGLLLFDFFKLYTHDAMLSFFCPINV
jgi:hypothetical protein